VNFRAELGDARLRFRVVIVTLVRILVVQVAGRARLEVFLVCRLGEATVDGRDEGILDGWRLRRRRCDEECDEKRGDDALQRAVPTDSMRAARSPPCLRIFTSRYIST
jgi:hypothetical protein